MIEASMLEMEEVLKILPSTPVESLEEGELQVELCRNLTDEFLEFQKPKAKLVSDFEMLQYERQGVEQNQELQPEQKKEELALLNKKIEEVKKENEKLINENREWTVNTSIEKEGEIFLKKQLFKTLKNGGLNFKQLIIFTKITSQLFHSYFG